MCEVNISQTMSNYTSELIFDVYNTSESEFHIFRTIVMIKIMLKHTGLNDTNKLTSV